MGPIRRIGSALAALVAAMAIALANGPPAVAGGDADTGLVLDRTWRVVDYDGKHTTSKCLGSRKTPECVADSYQACWVRSDFSLCRAVAVDQPEGFMSLDVKDIHVASIRAQIRFDRAEPVTQDDIDYLRVMGSNPHPELGDVFILGRERIRWYDFRDKYFHDSNRKIAWYLRRIGDEWYYVMARVIRE